MARLAIAPLLLLRVSIFLGAEKLKSGVERKLFFLGERTSWYERGTFWYRHLVEREGTFMDSSWTKNRKERICSIILPVFTTFSSLEKKRRNCMTDYYDGHASLHGHRFCENSIDVKPAFFHFRTLNGQCKKMFHPHTIRASKQEAFCGSQPRCCCSSNCTSSSIYGSKNSIFGVSLSRARCVFSKACLVSRPLNRDLKTHRSLI